MIDTETLRQQLINHEGLRYLPYKDSKGYWTIGIGHCIDARITGDKDLEHYYLTAGPITDNQINNLYNNDIVKVIKSLDGHIPWWEKLSDVRGRVLIDMTFNMGIYNLLKFKKMLKFLENNWYQDAADEMINSDWYHETKDRARRLTRWMREDKDLWNA